MPYMIICAQEDGSVHVNAFPGDAPPEMLQDAQVVDSVEAAGAIVPQVLGGAPQGEELVEDEPQEAMAPQDMGAEDAMQHGYDRAKKGL